MLRYRLFLFALLLGLLAFSALSESAPMAVSWHGSGLSVYASADGKLPIGKLYNGFESVVFRSDASLSRWACPLTEDFTVWISLKKAHANLPEGWVPGGDNRGLYGQKPCDMILAEVVPENAPLYSAPDGSRITAFFSPGTRLLIAGEFREGAEGVYFVLCGGQCQGFMPMDCLRPLKTLDYASCKKFFAE